MCHAAAADTKRRNSGSSGSGSEGRSEEDAIPHNAANPAEIRTDGAGTLLQARTVMGEHLLRTVMGEHHLLHTHYPMKSFGFMPVAAL